jgi:hypothetical protein
MSKIELPDNISRDFLYKRILLNVECCHCEKVNFVDHKQYHQEWTDFVITCSYCDHDLLVKKYGDIFYTEDHGINGTAFTFNGTKITSIDGLKTILQNISDATLTWNINSFGQLSITGGI